MTRTLNTWIAIAVLFAVPSALFAQADQPPAAIAPAAVPPPAVPPGNADAPAPPAEEVKAQHWEFGISIRAAGGPCAGLYGTFPVPANWPEQEVKVQSEEITPQVRQHKYREGEGLKQMLFEVPQLAAGETANCLVTLEIVKRPQAPPADPSALVVPKDVPRDLRKYLAASPLIESSAAKVKTLARELTAQKETAWEAVQAIQAGVRERVQFEVDPKDVFQGALGALRDGKADKEDLTAVFVAVCRAAKIPARMVWAMDYCYAEFYLEEKPQPGEKQAKGAWYPCVVHEEAPLGAMTDVRPILEKGDNFRIPEERAPQRFVKEYLTGKGGGGKPAVEFRRRQAD